MPKVEEGLLERGKFTIGLTDGEKYKGWLKLFDLEGAKLPCAAVFFPETEKKLKYGEIENEDYTKIGDFIDNIIAEMNKEDDKSKEDKESEL